MTDIVILLTGALIIAFISNIVLFVLFVKSYAENNKLSAELKELKGANGEKYHIDEYNRARLLIDDERMDYFFKNKKTQK